MEGSGPNVVENRKVPKVSRVGAQSKQYSRKRVLQNSTVQLKFLTIEKFYTALFTTVATSHI